MPQLEDDLKAALKELLEASIAMTDGKKFTADEMERYHRAVKWSKQVIELAER
jgi:hypothetical protein